MSAMKHICVIPGYVWCDKHCAIHDDTTNPYGYNEGDPDNCTEADHRQVHGYFSEDEEF